MGHAAGHDGKEFRFGQGRQIGADHQGRLGLAHKGIGGHIEGLGPASAHKALHHPGHPLDNPLHDAKVIEDGHEGGEEDNRRQHLESEDHPEAALAAALAEGAEDELRPVGSEAEEGDKEPAQPGENIAADRGLEHKKGKGELQQDADQDQLPVDGFFVGGKNIGEEGDEEQAHQAVQDRDHVRSAPWLAVWGFICATI